MDDLFLAQMQEFDTAQASAVPPIRDVALCIELGRRPVLGLMTGAEWDEHIARVIGDWPDDWPASVSRATEGGEVRC